MKEATITIPDELEAELEAMAQARGLTLAQLFEDALYSYLVRQRFGEREVRLPTGPFRIRPASKGSGKSDISIEHDRYFAEQ